MPTTGPVEILIIALIAAMFVMPIVLVIAMLRRRPGPAEPARDPALETLRDRFASGDIDEAEYERLRSVLQRG